MMRIVTFLLLLAMVLAACYNNTEKSHVSDDIGEVNEKKEINPSAGQRLLAAASRNDVEQVQDLMGGLNTESELNEALAGVMNEYHKYEFHQQQDVELVRQLLRKGADPNYIDQGEPIIFLARTVGLTQAFCEDKRTNFNAKTSDGGTLLMAAIGLRNHEKVEYLLKLGVDPNEEMVRKSGEILIPLHTAIQYDDDYNIVKFLLNHPNIDLTKKNKENYTPLEWARYLNKAEIVSILEAKNSSTAH